MTTRPAIAEHREERLEQILADYLERLESGQAESAEDLALRYPEFATEFAEFLAFRGELNAAVGPLRAALLGGGEPGAGPDPTADKPGLLGDFRLLREVGRGGMGIVYEAEQISLGRRVALKVLPFAATLDVRQLQRFKNEALAAAALDHPHVVDVYGVGCERATHYYAMRFVDGHSLAEVIDQLRRLRSAESGRLPDSIAQAFDAAAPGAADDRGPVTPQAETEVRMADSPTRRSSFPPAFFRSVAELGLCVAEALDHAHGQGVVHRDIKPSNLLLDGEGKVWVADFGLARLDTAESLTGSGNLVGTLRYMAPEQAVGRSPADFRGDVYGLGVTLYELLTLQPAFAGGDREDLLRRVAIAEPAAPRRLDPSIPADLETIVLRAMAKEPSERYSSARALADDLRRFLEDRPILARRPGPVARLRRWARRHRPTVIGTAAGLILLFVLALVGLSMSYRAVSEERDQTRAAEREGQIRLVDTLIARARAGRTSEEPGRRLESWKAICEAARLVHALGLGEDRLMELRSEGIACLAVADVRLERSWLGHPPGSTDRPAFDANLEYYARSDRQGTISIRRVADDEQLQSLPGTARAREATGAAESGAAFMWFSPDGSRLAVQYYQEPGQQRNFRLWDWRQQRVVLEPPFLVTNSAVAFRPDGRHVALGQPDGTVTIHDPATGTEAASPIRLGIRPMHLSFSPDGARLAATSFGGRQVLVLDANTGERIDTFSTPHGGWSVAWHPAGALLAVGCEDRNIHIRDTVARRSHAVLRGHHTGAAVAGFAAGGDLLVSYAWDGSTRLWDPWGGRELVRFPGMARQVSRDGRRVACEAGWNLAVWEVTPSREYRTLPRSGSADTEGLTAGGFSRDGRWFSLGTATGARLWDMAFATEVELPPVPPVSDVQFHPRRDELLTASAGGLYRWQMTLQSDVLRIGPGEELLGPGRAWRFSQDGEGRRLTTVGFEGGWVLDLEHRSAGARRLEHAKSNVVATSRDGRWAATGSHKGLGVKVWDLATGDFLDPILTPDEWGTTPVFSPDNRWLATMTPGALCLWRAETRQMVRRLQRDEQFSQIAFSPDSRQVAVALPLSGVELIDVETGELCARLHAPDMGPATWLGFRPDGGQLLVVTKEGEVRVWDLWRIREQLRQVGLDWDPPADQSLAAKAGTPAKVTRVEFVGYPLGLLPRPYFQRASEFGRRGEWAEAAEIHAKALELAPSDHLLWHDDAPLRLEVGDIEGYRRVCRGMLTRFGGTNDPNTAERTAKTCCLAPGAVADCGPVVKLADRALVGTEEHREYPSYLLARGMAAYRSGDFAGGIEWLRRSLSADLKRAAAEGLAHLFLAMSHHRLGRAEKAGGALAAARAASDRIPKPGELSYEWLRFIVVRREAEKLLGKNAER